MSSGDVLDGENRFPRFPSGQGLEIVEGVKLPHLFDGVSIWVLKDGQILNRFSGEGSQREKIINDEIIKIGQRIIKERSEGKDDQPH